MNSSFDSMIAFPVSRAHSYSHKWPENPSLEDAPILDLGVDHLIVDTLVRSGTVTLAGSTRNAGSDAYGQEFDLPPSDAQALGHQLIAAAAECEAAE